MSDNSCSDVFIDFNVTSYSRLFSMEGSVPMFFVTGEYRSHGHLSSKTPQSSKAAVHNTKKDYNRYLLETDKMAAFAGIKLVAGDWKAFWMVIK